MTTTNVSKYKDMELMISRKYHGVIPCDLRTLPLAEAPKAKSTVAEIYGDILTEQAVGEWREAEAKFERGEIRNTFKSWYFYPVKSGSWIRNPKYDSHVNLQGILNTYWNRQVIGRFADTVYPSEEAETCTSVIEFVGHGWCSTISGSIYAIPSENCTSSDCALSLPYIHSLP